MNEIVFIVREDPSGGFTAHALGASIFTEANDRDALPSQIKDAVRCHFDYAEMPEQIRLQFLREEILLL